MTNTLGTGPQCRKRMRPAHDDLTTERSSKSWLVGRKDEEGITSCPTIKVHTSRSCWLSWDDKGPWKPLNGLPWAVDSNLCITFFVQVPLLPYRLGKRKHMLLCSPSHANLKDQPSLSTIISTTSQKASGGKYQLCLQPLSRQKEKL